RVRIDLLEALDVEPLVHEVARERLRARILQHALDLRQQLRVVGEIAALRGREQLVVRERVPEEERELRRECPVVDSIKLAGRDTFGRFLDAVQEERAREDTGQRGADPLLEAAPLDAVSVVREKLRQI